MRRVLLLAVVLTLTSCGEAHVDDPDAGVPDDAGTVEVERPEACPDESTLVITSDVAAMEAFEPTDTIGILTGVPGWEEHKRRADVVLANFPPVLGQFEVAEPAEQGQYAVRISFVGAFGPDDEPPPEIETGDYEVGLPYRPEPSVQVIIKASEGDLPELRNLLGWEGEGTLTHISDAWVCGSVSVTGPENTTIQATFAEQVAHDFWSAAYPSP